MPHGAYIAWGRHGVPERRASKTHVEVAVHELEVLRVVNPEAAGPGLLLRHAGNGSLEPGAEALLGPLVVNHALLDGVLDDVDPALRVHIVEEPLERLALKSLTELPHRGQVADVVLKRRIGHNIGL